MPSGQRSTAVYFITDAADSPQPTTKKGLFGLVSVPSPKKGDGGGGGGEKKSGGGGLMGMLKGKAASAKRSIDLQDDDGDDDGNLAFG